MLNDPVIQYPFDADPTIHFVSNSVSYRIETLLDAKTIPSIRTSTPFTVKNHLPTSFKDGNDKSRLDGTTIELNVSNRVIKPGEDVKGIITVNTSYAVINEYIEARLECISSHRSGEFRYIVQKEKFNLNNHETKNSFQFQFTIPNGLHDSLYADEQTDTKVAWGIVAMCLFHTSDVGGKIIAENAVFARTPILVTNQLNLTVYFQHDALLDYYS